jgi:hypothetical protein
VWRDVPELRPLAVGRAEGRRLQQAHEGEARLCQPEHSAWIPAGGGDSGIEEDVGVLRQEGLHVLEEGEGVPVAQIWMVDESEAVGDGGGGVAR